MKFKQIAGGALLTAVALILAGCIVTGTFIADLMVRDLTFAATENLYYEQVDLTENEDWDEHKDDIKSIDLVGFELWIENTSGSAQTFKGYIDDANNQLYQTQALVEANATIILDELTLAPGDNYVSYPESFAYIKNLETMRTLLESGQFNVYGLATGGTFELDSLRVVVTFTAGQ